MHIVIINASPHATAFSNTAKILEPFTQGILQAGGTVETYHLAQANQKVSAKEAFLKHNTIIFALPVFAATIPGFFMEFLEELANADTNMPERKIAFILQSGFPEACQRKNCEAFLKTIPALLHSSFAGILSQSINLRFVENKTWQEALDAYFEMGKRFIKNNGTFFCPEVSTFGGPERLTDRQAKMFNRIFNFYCRHMAEELGCTVSLSHQPKQEEKT